MKLTALLLGSLLISLAGAQIGCSAASPDIDPSSIDDGSESELRGAKTVKYSEFVADVLDLASQIGEGDCSFTAKSQGGTLTVTATDEEAHTTTITVSARDKITRTTKADGEYQSYKIAGVGSVLLVRADDMYNAATVGSTKTGKSASCEIDF